MHPGDRGCDPAGVRNARSAEVGRFRSAVTAVSGIRILLAVLWGLAAGLVYGREDMEYWSNWTASYEISEVSDASAYLSLRFRDDMSDHYLYVSYLTYSRDVGPVWDLFLQIQMVWSENPDDAWETKQSLVFGARYECDIPRFAEIKLQNRVYHRLDSPARWDHHRPRIAVSRDWGRWGLTLYNEIRLDLTGERERDLFRTRMGATVSWDATDRLTVGLGYARTADHLANGTEWFNAILSAVSFGF